MWPFYTYMGPFSTTWGPITSVRLRSPLVEGSRVVWAGSLPLQRIALFQNEAADSKARLWSKNRSHMSDFHYVKIEGQASEFFVPDLGFFSHLRESTEICTKDILRLVWAAFLSRLVCVLSELLFLSWLIGYVLPTAKDLSHLAQFIDIGLPQFATVPSSMIVVVTATATAA